MVLGCELGSKIGRCVDQRINSLFYGPLSLAKTRGYTPNPHVFPTVGFRSLFVASGIRQTHARSTALHGHDGGLLQIRLVLGDNASANRRLIQIAEIDEPDDTGMGSAERNRELAEILVERYQYLAVLRRMGKNLVVAWIGAPVPDAFHVVPGLLESLFRTRPDAATEQELQAASSVMAGSTRSWPTTRRA